MAKLRRGVQPRTEVLSQQILDMLREIHIDIHELADAMVPERSQERQVNGDGYALEGEGE